MYLSKLEIIGFKSFAQRTTLKFDPGMTAIVGPNGCGKSNVVDAIRWALGEQKASILRSDLMENVIFNGSRYRKPLGMAEVSLTIENTKGILPTEYQEVTITRRLFRSGESEYLLNKAQCRLKDIVELFMDTGMGANAYSVIELKMIEQILSDRTEDRRKLFEEAAGVTKYKARRKEALRRLDQVSDDLERIDDIIKEVTKNVASLERQAEKASKYNDVQQTLRTLEVDVIEREYSQSVSRIEPLRALLAQTNETRSSVIVEVERIEGLIDVVTREEEEIEERIRTTERALREKNETLSRLRETIAATEERIRSLKTQDERNTHEIARLESERTDEISARENATNSLVALGEDARVTAVDRDELQVRYDQRRGELDEKRQAMAAAQTNAASIIVERDSLSGETSRLRARIEELERRCTNINDEINRIVIQSRNLKEKETEFSIAHENALRSLADAEQLRREAVSERESIKERIDSLQNESFVIQREIGERLSKIEFLTSLVERTLGTGDGAEFLLKNHSWSRTGTPKTVLDVVSTSAEYRAAIENCLGEAGHYFVAETRAEALDAIETLKHSQKGKATFIILDEIPVSSGVSHPGYTNALSVISCEPKYTPLFSLLVGDTVIAHDINEAFSLRTAGIANRFITRDGELVTINGVVRGGSKKMSEGSLVGKQQQIRELEEKVDELRQRLELTNTEIASLAAIYDGFDIAALEETVNKRRDDARICERQLEQTGYELTSCEQQTSSLTRELDELKLRIAESQVRFEEIAPMLNELDAKYKSISSELTALSVEVSQFEQLLAEETARYTAAQLAASQAQLRYEQTKNEADRLQQSIESRLLLIEEKKNESIRLIREAEENSSKLSDLRSMLTGLESEIGETETSYSALTSERKDKQEQLHRYREELRRRRSEQEETINAFHELELKIQELDGKIASLIERAKTEFDLDTLNINQYSEDDTFSFGEARDRISQLKTQLRNLGNVNLLAYDEFTKEKERLDFLTTQRKDLIEAQQTLHQTIEEINTTATTKFTETFEEVRKYFQQIFQSLFTEGDECELRLEEGVDPLEAQIEIIAKPRGKKPNTIESLSGGEKTMTAIALLFAIYLVKPSPFCILDEVDAPLDDANIDRFLQLIRRFTTDTQFIVVTHNKRTMAASDALYGVTQEEDGVSKIVSVRLKREPTAVAA